MKLHIQNIFTSSYYRYFSGIFLLLIFSFFVLDLMYPLNTEMEYSKVVKSSEGNVLSSFLSSDDKWRFYTKTNENSEYLRKSIIYKEDRYFYYHLGVNPVSVLRAIFLNITNNKIISGGSTITMQTARLLEPKKRTYSNKLVEMFRALQLEFHYSKDDILELYLNKIPFGSNIEGTGAASVLYYGKNPINLSLAESVSLAVIPNRPNILNISSQKNKINTFKNRLLRKMERENIYDKNLIKDAIIEIVNPIKLNVPRTAPHFCFKVISENKGLNNIKTTINYTLQSRAEETLKNYISNWQNYGIKNGSAIIIDNSSNQIVSYIGSNDFDDKLNFGEVDGASSVRSPGSTLKPLLYALMIDKGNITPKISVLDVPILDPSYSPGNFDGNYRGKVTVEYALSQSLNVPAVNLLKNFGYLNFSDKLSGMNFKSIGQNKKNLGLSMILGGCGVTLEELTGMYTIFPNSGTYTMPKYINSIQERSKKILSPQSAYIISNILTKLERPDYPKVYYSAKGVPLISWKTGTSQGRRDGWAIGYNKRYTIGVWTGNFTGKANSFISGANVAVPLLFDLFNLLPESDRRAKLSAPQGLMTRTVDAATGLLPSEYTTKTITDYYIPGVSITKISDNLKPVWVSLDEKISYCSECVPAKEYKSKIYESYELELLLYYQYKNINYEKIPPHNPNCISKAEGDKPIIKSPVDKSEYFIESDGESGITFVSKKSPDANMIYWFVNDKIVSSSNSDDSYFWIPNESGEYTITCTDSKARTSAVRIKVKVY